MPSTVWTGLEKVRRSGVAGETSEPGAGLAATLADLLAGNQVTLCGLPGRSQVRGTPATMTVPAASWEPRLTELRGWAKARWCRWPGIP